MEYDERFGPRGQTPQQRQQALNNALAISRSQGLEPDAAAQALFARVVAGELSMEEVIAELHRQGAGQATHGLE